MPAKKSPLRSIWILVAAVMVVLGILLATSWSKVVSRVYAQLGNIELDKGQAAMGASPGQGDKHLQRAEIYFRRALNWNASDTSIFVKLGTTHLAAGRIESALDYLTRAKEKRPSDRLATLWLGVAYSRAGRDQVAVDLLREAGAFGQLLMLADQYAGSDDHSNAASAFRAAISIRPDFAQAHRRLGEEEEAGGYTNEAIRAYSSYVSLEKADPVQRYLVEAHVAGMQERWSDAAAGYEKAFELAAKTQSAQTPARPGQPKTREVLDAPDLHFRLGVAYGALGRNQDALRELSEAVRLGGTSVSYYGALANAYFDLGDFQSSLTWYRKVLETHPKDWWATERVQALAAGR